MNERYNVLQYEFFHVGGKDAGSLEGVMAECHERTADSLPLAISGDDIGPGIKTVIRVYDVTGQVTSWTKEIADLKVQREVHYRTRRNNFFTKRYSRWKISKLDQRMDALQALMIRYIIEYLGASFKGEWNVAREIWDHAFRLARREEYIELLEAVKKAKGLWLFIFEPNDLLSDSNKGIVSMM